MTTVTEDDIGKPIFTASGQRVGTLGGVNGPTLYLDIDDDIDHELLSAMKVAQITGIKADGKNLAGMPLAAVAEVTDDEIRFWASYATAPQHEAVDYEEIPEEDSNVELDDA